ncbi:uncharacterized protein N7477_009878 [Penicillium maclennaniae]|uniref:uncharacterized protein n=1 Tax=Penicillium maclennaniae TaxID=1343394 RepID=UPI0025419B84|nr:uncharacterized protein N7477_009878 [Penicillium maclennaniae]KAJ5662262.1 hypothetical protein N7477_009878 [Penicillium maclennaniae]
MYLLEADCIGLRLSPVQAPFVGISLGGHHAKGSDASSSITTSSVKRGASIVAHGGNSLLSFKYVLVPAFEDLTVTDPLGKSSPELWAPTVESYHNWRTIQQENIVDLPTLLSEFNDDKDEHKKAIATLQSYIRTQQEAAKPKDMIRVVIGNRWRTLPGHGSYLARWEFFLSSSRPDIVKQVTVRLDPTFIKPKHVFVHAQGEDYMRRVSITGSTSGVFTIMADVELIDDWNWKDWNWKEQTSDMKGNVGKRRSGKEMRLYWRLGPMTSRKRQWPWPLRNQMCLLMLANLEFEWLGLTVNLGLVLRLPAQHVQAYMSG